jgi:hypothetical protein
MKKKDQFWTLVAVALAIALGVAGGYLLAAPRPSSGNPVSQLNGRLASWLLDPLPRPSSLIETGSILSGRLTWFMPRNKAWNKPADFHEKPTVVLARGSYMDQRDATGEWKTVLPGIGSLENIEGASGSPVPVPSRPKWRTSKCSKCPRSSSTPAD